MKDPATTPVAKSWDTYWRGTRDTTAYSSHGTDHPALQAFWLRLFEPERSASGVMRIVDIASGNGAVAECLHAALRGKLPELCCVDISAAAVAALVRRFPEARGIVADARAIPLRSGTFRLVASQFGLEYAGPAALPEAARLAAPGGRIALLLHSREGSIYRDCAANLDAVEAVRRAGFLPLALRAFEAGFDVCRGGDRAPYDAAAARLQPAFRAIEAIMQKHGQHVAGDSVLRLYNDIARIQRDLRSYDPEEILEWLRRMDAELPPYSGRMASMCAAAMSREAFDGLGADLRRMDFDLLRAEPLHVAGRPPLAWALIAQRR